MSYEPCGSIKIDGKEIIHRLAKEMGVSAYELKAVFLKLLNGGK